MNKHRSREARATRKRMRLERTTLRILANQQLVQIAGGNHVDTVSCDESCVKAQIG